MVELTTKQRALLVHEHLFNLLYEDRIPSFEEFTKGGISACCVILEVENPITGHKFEGDLREDIFPELVEPVTGG